MRDDAPFISADEHQMYATRTTSTKPPAEPYAEAPGSAERRFTLVTRGRLAKRSRGAWFSW